MVNLLKRKRKEDPACQQYPEALWPLLALRDPRKNTVV